MTDGPGTGPVQGPLDDPESSDAETPEHFDLTPRTAAAAPSSGSGKKWLAVGGVGLVVVALAFVLFNGLRSASTFFYNVDEAVALKSSLGTKRFRMQCNVVDGTVKSTSAGVDFVIKYKDVDVPVHHVGDPPELFGPKIPVVLEGSFAANGKKFESDQILVRHDSTYDEKNKDRVRQANQDAKQRASG